MEKSRPRNPARRPLIIERPDLQPRSQRLVSMLLTVFFWVLWAYLWMPLLALLGWALGVTLYYEEMIMRDGHRILFEVLPWYAAAVALLGGSLVAWAMYNYYRFRGRERRSAGAPVSVAEVAAYAGVHPVDLARWRHARLLHVTHDPDGRIQTVRTVTADSLAPGPSGPATSGPPAR